MIALINDRLVTGGHGFANGNIKGCTTIRQNLAGTTTAQTLTSYTTIGVRTVTRVTKEYSKIGITGRTEGEPDQLDCEFTYVETQEADAGAKRMQYAMVVTGIRSKPNPDGSAGLGPANLSEDIGILVHRALLAP
jgi:hypothetical protein